MKAEDISEKLARFPYKVNPFNLHMVLLCDIVTMLDIRFDGALLSFTPGPFTISLSQVIPLILAGVCGFPAAMLFVLTVFAYYMFHDFQLSYTVFMFLLSTSVMFIMSRQSWFRKKSLTFLASVILALIIGNGWYLLLCLLSPVGFSQVTVIGQVALFIYGFPESLIACILVYLFFTKNSDDVLERSDLGRFYTARYLSRIKEKGVTHMSRLGKKVTIGLTVDLLAVVSASIIFSGALITLATAQQTEYEQSAEMHNTAERESGIWGSFEYLEYLQSDVEDTGTILSQVRYGEFYNLRAFLIELSMMIACVAVPVVALSYHILSMITLRPLEDLTEYVGGYADAIAKDRRGYAEKMNDIEPGTDDEIKALHNNIRSLMTEINDYIDKLQKEQELESALSVAQEANKAKSVFLSNMSHEIRTPIASIMGFDEMILRETKEKGTRRYATDIMTSGRLLLDIVNDILDLSKIEAGKMEIIKQQYDLSSVVNNLISIVDVQTQNKGLKLDVNINPEIPMILYGDDTKIKQCIMNILSNAVKYTEEGHVGFYMDYYPIDSKNVSLYIKVTDTGVGIQSKDIEKLYVPFERLDEIRYHYIEGTGLGLDIVKRILAMMDSRLEVHSIYGEGSTFSFSINQPVISWEPIGDVTKRYENTKDYPNRYEESFHAPGARILVVDDTNMNLIVFKGLLKKTQIQIDTVESGREALRMVQQKKYDLIFLDHRMPGMDGIETHNAMVKMKDNPNGDVPIIALTANALSGAREEYINNGFQDYLAKPVSAQRLENMIIKYLPEELLIKPGDPDFIPTEDDPNQIDDIYDDKDDVDLSEFDNLTGLNIKIALSNCDQLDILRDALWEFLITIPNRADAIEKYVEEMDYRNFTVAVHALKSNARLIGAMKLSDEAAYLEQCGNSEDTEQIREKAPHLLKLYRSYEEKLEPLRENHVVPEEELLDISETDFAGALKDMRELIGVFDYDNAYSIMKMLEGYKVPDKYKEKWSRIEELMAEVDLDALLSELGDIE